jgi:hypothetical protein
VYPGEPLQGAGRMLVCCFIFCKTFDDDDDYDKHWSFIGQGPWKMASAFAGLLVEANPLPTDGYERGARVSQSASFFPGMIDL